MEPTARHRRTPNPIRVIIVDDHELIRITLSAAVAAAGIQVVATCADGVEAVAAATRLNPDVAVVDLVMPRMDGVEATKRIRDVAPRTRVVILTATTPGPRLDAALAAGASTVVFKDSGSAAVVAAIRAEAR